MSSPLNKLADALPSFILQMQEIKTRQDYYESLTQYRQGMLAQTIIKNKLEEEALRATEQLRGVERGREVREKILEARGKYGEPGARAIFPEATARQFPQGLPPEKEPEAKKPSAGTVSRVVRRRDQLAEVINARTKSIEQMRETLDLGPGKEPKTPDWWNRKGEQANLNKWNRLWKERAIAQTSLDSLQQAAEKTGIATDVFELGAIPIQPYQVGIEDPFGMRR